MNLSFEKTVIITVGYKYCTDVNSVMGQSSRKFLMSVWDRGKEISYGNGSVGNVSGNNPVCEVSSTESGMTVEH